MQGCRRLIFPIDNRTNAAHHTIGQNRHTYRVSVNPQNSTSRGAFFRPTWPHSISHFAAARQ
jgi:hypothetical protein